MYGVHIPHDSKEALELNQENSNDCWKKAIRLEIHELMDCDIFHDNGLIKTSVTTMSYDLCCKT